MSGARGEPQVWNPEPQRQERDGSERDHEAAVRECIASSSVVRSLYEAIRARQDTERENVELRAALARARGEAGS